MIILDDRFAVIDADFYIKMTKYACDKGNLFLQLMKDLGVQPVMHKYVADIELKRDPYIQDMVKAGCLETRSYEDYLVTDKDREDYEAYFLDAYESMNRFDFPEE